MMTFNCKSNAKELFPELETPAKTINFSFGKDKDICLDYFQMLQLYQYVLLCS